MSYIGGFFKGIWTVMKVTQTVLLLLVLVPLFLLLIGSMTGGKMPTIPSGGAALVIDFKGSIVERRGFPDIGKLFGDQPATILLRDLLRGIDEAAKDDRIKAVVMDLDEFQGAMPATLHYLGDKLKALRASGKKVIAVGDTFGQSAYLLASYADEIHMHPYGSVLPTGYGIYRTYYKDLLDRLEVTVNNFTVGEFKSAGEPYFRNDMSEPAKEANMAFMGVLWENYKSAVNAGRGLTGGGLGAIVDTVVESLRSAGGDAAVAARDAKLVDTLKTRDEQETYLKDLVGADEKGKSYKKVSLADYLKIVRAGDPDPAKSKKSKVAIVVAEGPIVMGSEDDEVVSADAVSKLLRKARDDETVKAVVFRVNSPGGSAFASEIIRREVQLVRDAGKPVVVSMGGVAASGGYWISMSADEVWASPTTITGSIGVVGIIPTFENTIKLVGLNVDGIGTTDLAGAGEFGRPIGDKLSAIVQLAVEDIYEKFLTLVADARKMTREQVHAIAQGRVWAGSTAKELGLIDQIGTLDDAIASAAKRASLTDYQTFYVEREPNDMEKFLLSLSDSDADASVPGLDRVAGKPSILDKLLGLAEDLDRDLMLDDPNKAYAICGNCLVQ